MTDTETDWAECMRALTDDFLPNIAGNVPEGRMPETFYAVNRLRRAARDAVHVLLELEESDRLQQ